MTVINQLPQGIGGEGTIKVVQRIANGAGTSEVLDSYNPDTEQNELVYYNMSASTWGQGGSASNSVAFQGSNDESTWTNINATSATYPTSSYIAGQSDAYRYYRMQFTGTSQRAYGLMCCVGPQAE